MVLSCGVCVWLYYVQAELKFFSQSFCSRYWIVSLCREQGVKLLGLLFGWVNRSARAGRNGLA
jgi:hypothetical protein